MTHKLYKIKPALCERCRYYHKTKYRKGYCNYSEIEHASRVFKFGRRKKYLIVGYCDVYVRKEATEC